MRDELYNGEIIMDAIRCLMREKPKPTYKWLDYLLTATFLLTYFYFLVIIILWLKNTLLR